MIEEFIQALKDDILRTAIEEFDAQVMKVEYVPGGRWSEWAVTTIKLGDKFYKIEQEEPATELQEGMELTTAIYEVEPYVPDVVYYKEVSCIDSWCDD